MEDSENDWLENHYYGHRGSLDRLESFWKPQGMIRLKIIRGDIENHLTDLNHEGRLGEQLAWKSLGWTERIIGWT